MALPQHHKWLAPRATLAVKEVMMSRPQDEVAVTSAAAMLFLASDDGSFVADSEPLADGGMCSA
jgi:hypothetical protein